MYLNFAATKQNSFRAESFTYHDESGEHNAGQNDVHHVELVSPLQVKCEDDVWVPLPCNVKFRARP